MQLLLMREARGIKQGDYYSLADDMGMSGNLPDLPQLYDLAV